MRATRLSNIQWFLNRSHHIAYMAFVVPGHPTPDEVAGLLDELMAVFPRLSCEVDLARSQSFHARQGNTDDLLDLRPPQDFARALAGLLADLAEPFTPGLKPTFHCSVVPSRTRKETLLFFSAPHAAIEGIDVLKLGTPTRERVAPTHAARLKRGTLAILTLPLGVLQIGLAPLLARPRHRFARRILSVDRQSLRAASGAAGVSWQGLLMASMVNSGCGAVQMRLRLPCPVAVSEVPKLRSGLDDHSIQFRMRLGVLRPDADLIQLARCCDRKLQPREKRRLSLYDIITAGLPLHRKLATWLPALYPARSFQYFPTSLSFSVVPPIRTHRFAGLAGATCIGSGSNTPALTSCIVTQSHGRVYMSLNLPADNDAPVAAICSQLADVGIDCEVMI
ncbi:hypothetical protein [Aliiroseovarius subalbicans]|uniref:hypothetical protein n=1 Tax=Aliiroseovarius subalbicans TaxID=2925840 RepID=UPI001F57572B|nr:hypothetical protein [Aliiroseovarius subalbicans]MCI2399657.1 hypothetical protein [Aliiroseovarius subalbicans]